MGKLLGVDLGTSSLRVMVVDENGQRLGSRARSYSVHIPQIGAAEQAPEIWFDAFVGAVRDFFAENGTVAKEVKSIAFSGQMHGLVCLDKRGAVLRPAMIWQDQRSAEVVKRLYAEMGRGEILRQTQNLISPGFLGASLAWLHDNEPDVFTRIDKVLLPKDYLAFRLTGSIQTDFSDAAGTGIFDNSNRRWSQPLVQALSIPENVLPNVVQSTRIIGTLRSEIAGLTGLPAGIPIAAGGADQCMQAIGNGLIETGDASVNIGTGGQIAAVLDEPRYDTQGRTNTFCHVLPGKWNLMGATLSAGSSLKWFAEKFLGTNDFRSVDESATKVPPGSEGLLFLPYLGGERTPIMNPQARGVFFGLASKHGQSEMARAVMEGVGYSLRNCLGVVQEVLGSKCERLIASGGGASSDLWRGILANILGLSLPRSTEIEQASLGAAATAGVAVGSYSDFEEAIKTLCAPKTKATEPDPEAAFVYDQLFGIFNDVYTSTAPLLQPLEDATKRATNDKY